MILRIRRWICLLIGHKPTKIKKHWDMVGNPKFDMWEQFECPHCGTIKDFERWGNHYHPHIPRS